MFKRPCDHMIAGPKYTWISKKVNSKVLNHWLHMSMEPLGAIKLVC